MSVSLFWKFHFKHRGSGWPDLIARWKQTFKKNIQDFYYKFSLELNMWEAFLWLFNHNPSRIHLFSI